MKPAIAIVALIVAACARLGDSVTEPITQTPVGFDSCALARPDLGQATQAELSLFAYDAAAPLNLEKTIENGVGSVEVSAISYDSPAGGRVTGLLFIPINRSSLRPGIVLMHGMPSKARDMTSYATTLANYGAVVIAIDAPFARRSGPSLWMTSKDRDEQVQLMKDLQRAVDVLRAQVNVDKSRIAYVGVSYGGASGVLFASIEHRIKAAALVVGDGGLITHATNTQMALNFMATLSCANRAAWFRDMKAVEGIRYFAFAKPTPLLLQNGLTDELVIKGDAELLHSAAPEPKKLMWYNAGHNLTAQAVLDRHDWLVEQIGLDPR